MSQRVTICIRPVAVFAGLFLLAACGGGGGGTSGDDARRLVLADIGEDIIVPALEDFAAQAAALKTAVDAHAAAPADVPALAAAQDAWRAAMTSWQYNEVLQVGPAGLSSGLDATPGGLDLRSYIYAFPLLNICNAGGIEELAEGGAPVNSSSLVDTTGLGALEFLLFNTEPNPCALGAPPSAAQRAAYAVRVADRILLVANDLVNRWDPAGGNFLTQWRTAGAGSAAFAIPQDALDALSVALFYLEKDTKDDKIADPTGIGATGLTACPTVSCPERLESRLSRHSGENVRVNAQAFLDVFAGVNGGMGMNDLLRGIGRDDLADDVAAALQAVLDHVSNNVPDFDTAVEDIDDETACINASSNPMPNVEPACSLHGYIKQAMDIFRVEIVAALSLATPNRAAGDND